ncbi:MAG TPA: hypothetical protein VM408_05360 [Methylomirabilota bacterium]|nr:hypothetical protein [Methylomirabilota bacterium]
MSSKAIVCTACGAAVSYGRLSCPACGELLASVAGAARTVVATAPAKRAARVARPTPSVLVDVAPAAVAAPPASSADWDVPADWDASAPHGGLLDDAPPAPHVARPGPSFLEDDDPATLDPSPTGETAAWQDRAPEWPVAQTQWREEVAPAVGAPAPLVTSPSLANAPGAYVPPLPATPAGPPAPARAWAGHPVGDDAATTDAPAKSGSELTLDRDRLTEFIGWLAVAGSAMAAAGFLLPWGMSVIGATGIDYVDRWGLAGPFHPLVVLAVLAVLGGALVPNPVPLWLRVGLPGLGLGALLLGLVWPYLLYLPGKGPGVVVVALGAVILLGAAIAALVADRHATGDRPV